MSRLDEQHQKRRHRQDQAADNMKKREDTERGGEEAGLARGRRNP